jgi:hypothetical protein
MRGLRPSRSRGIAGISDAILERWFTPAYRSADNADFIGYRLMLERTPLEGYTGTCAAIRDSDFTGVQRCARRCRRSVWSVIRRRIDAAFAGGRTGAADPGGDVSGNPGCGPPALHRSSRLCYADVIKNICRAARLTGRTKRGSRCQAIPSGKSDMTQQTSVTRQLGGPVPQDDFLFGTRHRGLPDRGGRSG